MNLEISSCHNNYEYVDLGLPSGTKWATCNIEVSLLNSDSLLFQFGRTDGYVYNDINNKFTTGFDNESLTGNSRINVTTSGKEYNVGQVLSLEDDAVHIIMGGDWIMPTKEDLEELYNNTTRQVTIFGDRKGMLFTSKINEKSIFFAFNGIYDCFDDYFYAKDKYNCLWSSSVDLNNNELAFSLYFDLYGYCHIESVVRAFGHSVRGVLK